ncbi:MAG: hypothetical protein IJI66_03485 [Erysipelotrichaceae bacterium]|nr:hypothetical protein [Erysipelotrichaceae bacterium]
MKKLLTVLLGICMILSLAACSQKQEEPAAPETPETPETVEEFDPSAKSEGVMTYAEYAAAAEGDEVLIEGFVQAAQSYWNGAKLYLADPDGAYFVYCDGKGEDINISEDDFAKVVLSTDYAEGWTGMATGAKVQVKGVKSQWSGEIEISEAEVTVLDSESWYAEAEDVTALLGTDALADKMNRYVAFKGMTVEASKDANGNDVAFLYNWDGSGEPGSDLYFNVSIDGNVYNFVVESYLCYDGSVVYDAVEALNIGDVVDMTGFLYWYNGPNPHITSIEVK